MLNKICFTLVLTVSPLFANAVILGGTNSILSGVQFIVTDILIPLVFTLALLLFFYGIVKYIWSEGQGKDEGKKFMIWGVVALFVMSSVWGIIYFIRGELGVDDDSTMPIPTIGNESAGSNSSGSGGFMGY